MATGKRKPEESTGETAAAKLDALGIDWYCEHIVSGKNMLTVARLAGVSARSVYRWLAADKLRLAQSNEARMISAESFVSLAELCIKEAKTDLQMDKARALAPHYRWHAAKIAPRVYGDRQELVGAGGAPLIPAVDQMDVARRICFGLARVDQQILQTPKTDSITASSS